RFFFSSRRRHTRSKRDWSSDVCSSDLLRKRVTTNRYGGKTTRYYVDEFHLLLREEQTAAYSIEIWKRFRKWGGAPTGITQNVKRSEERRVGKEWRTGRGSGGGNRHSVG